MKPLIIFGCIAGFIAVFIGLMVAAAVFFHYALATDSSYEYTRPMLAYFAWFVFLCGIPFAMGPLLSILLYRAIA